MQKIIVSEFVTLDGIMEAPGGEPTHPHTGWALELMNSESINYKLKEVLEAESLLIGRTTYETFASAWPNRSGAFADKMNSMQKYVVSGSLQAPEWNNTTLIRGDVIEQITRLKERARGSILLAGSCTLVRALTKHQLVDEYRLMIFPVLLGSGKKLFSASPRKTSLRLVGAHSFASGVVINTYQPLYEK